jgi:hypothetical protein
MEDQIKKLEAQIQSLANSAFAAELLLNAVLMDLDKPIRDKFWHKIASQVQSNPTPRTHESAQQAAYRILGGK